MIGSAPASTGLIDVLDVIDPNDDDRFFNFGVFGRTRYAVFGNIDVPIPPFFVGPTPSLGYSLPPGSVGYTLAGTNQPPTIADVMVEGVIGTVGRGNAAGIIPGGPPPFVPNWRYSSVVDTVFPVYAVGQAQEGAPNGIDHVSGGTFPVIKPLGN